MGCINFFAGPGGAVLPNEFKFELRFDISGGSVFGTKLQENIQYIITSDGDEDDGTGPIGDPVEQPKEGETGGALAFRAAATLPRTIFIAVVVCMALAVLAFIVLRRKPAAPQEPKPI